ncbi:unnamed protein product, partial [marine sediment metagenome]
NYGTHYWCTRCRSMIAHAEAERFPAGKLRCPECGHPLRTRPINSKSKAMVRIDA